MDKHNSEICKMCGSDNTTTYYSMIKKDFVFECEQCGYWEIIDKPPI